MFYLNAYWHSYHPYFFVLILLVLGPRRQKGIMLKRQTDHIVVISVQIMQNKLSPVSKHLINAVEAVLLNGTVKSPMEGTTYKTVAKFCFDFYIHSIIHMYVLYVCEHLYVCNTCVQLHVPCMPVYGSQIEISIDVIHGHFTTLVFEAESLVECVPHHFSQTGWPESARNHSASVSNSGTESKQISATI